MIHEYEHERVSFFTNKAAGLKCIIAVHDTTLGPAVGGCRLFPYATEADALFDVLRLSRGMSFKNAIAGLPIGGAKGVIIADPSQKTDAMFEAFGECVETFGGKYITAEDVNTDTHDADVMLRTTSHVIGKADVSGDPSPMTAIGVYDGIRATAQYLFGSDDLSGLTFAVQGLGKVGLDVATKLAEAGAKLIVSGNTRPQIVEDFAKKYGAKIVDKAAIYGQECDIFVPCAMGAILNYETIPQLKCKGVAGAANNQIFDNACGQALKDKGIAYAPDFVINGGGTINACQEVFTTYNKENVLKQIHNIYNSVYDILEESGKTGVPEQLIAEKKAQEIIDKGRK